MQKIRILELFAGIGACSKALENLGFNLEIVDAVEIDKYAIKSFNAVHGTNFETQDICKWNKDLKDIDIITHGSPCFLAGEKVNTKNGFKNIENIIIGDYVKSHDGSYNKVIKTMKNKNNIIYDICCSATHNINTTYNHPFYVLRENNLKWLEANELTTRDFMCIPKNKCQNEIDNNNSTLPLKSIRFWYLIGRFIGDGWVTKRKERNYNISGIKICCAKEELEDLENKLCNILHYCVVEDKSTYKLQFTNKELGEFCSEFGIGAKNKHIPQWVLDLKTEYLEYLLMGILESDGCYSQNRYKVTTISRDLAYNIGELVLKVENVPYHIYKTIRPTTHKIEERIVNQNNTYQITWSNIYNKNINFIDDDYLYSRVRKINSREEEKDVYNIEVKNTHTYCVNNIAVHNCQDFSVAGKQAGGDIGSGTRSSLMYETIRIVGKIRPKYVLWENVKNILSKRHKHNFDNYINTMKALGYNSYYQVLNAKDYGIPQNRERVYTISIRNDIDKGNFAFPQKEELKLKLKDMLEEEVDEKYYLSDEQINRIKFSTFNQQYKRIQEKEYCDTLCARDWKDPKCIEVADYRYDEGLRIRKNGLSPCLTLKTGSKSLSGNTLVIYNNVKSCVLEKNKEIINPLKGITKYGWHFEQNVYDINGCIRSLKSSSGSGNIPKAIISSFKIRKLTPKECWKLMGFNDEDFEKAQKVNSNTQLYKQAGNSIVVNVLEKIFKNLFKEGKIDDNKTVKRDE